MVLIFYVREKGEEGEGKGERVREIWRGCGEKGRRGKSGERRRQGKIPFVANCLISVM